MWYGWVHGRNTWMENCEGGIYDNCNGCRKWKEACGNCSEYKILDLGGYAMNMPCTGYFHINIIQIA